MSDIVVCLWMVHLHQEDVKWSCPNATSNKELIISAKIFFYATLKLETQNKTCINKSFNKDFHSIALIVIEYLALLLWDKDQENPWNLPPGSSHCLIHHLLYRMCYSLSYCALSCWFYHWFWQSLSTKQLIHKHFYYP